MARTSATANRRRHAGNRADSIGQERRLPDDHFLHVFGCLVLVHFLHFFRSGTHALERFHNALQFFLQRDAPVRRIRHPAVHRIGREQDRAADHARRHDDQQHGRKKGAARRTP